MRRFCWGSWLAVPISASLGEGVSELKVGIPRKGFYDELQADVEPCMNEALAVVTRLVTKVCDFPFEVARRRTVFDAEIYEYHAEMATKTPELYDPHTLVRVRNCASVSATDYIRARAELEAQRRAAKAVFEQVDVVITPTTPMAAPPLAELLPLQEPDLRNFETRYLLRNTLPFSILYWPSVSVPCGFTREGLPVGMQISAKPGADLTALRLAYAYEQATDWHTRIAPQQ